MKLKQNNMKKEFNYLPKDFLSLASKPIQQVYEEINSKCNNFLKKQRGLQYLLLKYPKLSPETAVREFYAHAYMCENYDGMNF